MFGIFHKCNYRFPFSIRFVAVRFLLLVCVWLAVVCLVPWNFSWSLIESSFLGVNLEGKGQNLKVFFPTNSWLYWATTPTPLFSFIFPHKNCTQIIHFLSESHQKLLIISNQINKLQNFYPNFTKSYHHNGKFPLWHCNFFFGIQLFHATVPG